MKMRVFLLLIFPAIVSTVAFTDFDQIRSNGQEPVSIQAAEPETLTAALLRKKKRLKTSNRAKRHNRSMAKKFKRKNEDTLRR
jgi:hypothetical protein